MDNRIKSVPFYFIRHGQTDANKHDRIVGSTDFPLNEAGLSQARRAAERLVGAPISKIIASPMLRARRTAEVIADRIGKDIIFVDDLKEFHAGELEDVPCSHVTKGDLETPEDVLKFIKHEILAGHVVDAELYNLFQQRVLRAMEAALAHEGPVLVVAHGGVAYALHELMGMPPRLIENCEPLFHAPLRGAEQQWIVHSIDNVATHHVLAQQQE